jgi:hypothetical protein
VNWTTLRFRIPGDSDTSLRSTYSSTDVRNMEVEAESQSNSGKVFYRLMVQ